MPLKVFISHSSKDKGIAIKLKEGLERFGLRAFVAHEDIKPSADWRDEIWRELNRANIFIALLTKAFRKSLWTDQEFGVALTSCSAVVPLQIDMLPYGFMSQHQALRLDLSDIDSTCLEIARQAIDSKRDLRVIFRKWLIRALAQSNSYKTSIEILKLINDLKGFNDSQANEIVCAGCNNDQIYGCAAASAMKWFYKAHSNLLTEKTIDTYRKTYEKLGDKNV